MHPSRSVCAFGLSLILPLLVNTFAQGIRFPNEISGHEFYGRGKLEALALKNSSRADAELVFGSDCNWTYCDYNDSWKVMFVYLDSFWPHREIKDGYEYDLVPFPQFFDRLWIIQFQAKKSMPLPPGTFSAKFEIEMDTMPHSGSEILNYRDTHGLIYTVLNGDESKGKLLNITYRIPLAERNDMFFVVGQRDSANIVQPRLIQN